MMRVTQARFRTTSKAAFALYEVLLGVVIFAVGVIALGRSVENCLNASTISEEEGAVRQILSDRMAVIQAAPGVPDAEKQFKIDSNYGTDKIDPEKCDCEFDRRGQHASERNYSCHVDCAMAARRRPAVETDSVLYLPVRIVRSNAKYSFNAE